MLRGPSQGNINNPGNEEVTRARSNDSLLKTLFEDFTKFGRNMLFGRFDDVDTLNISAEFSEKIQSQSLIGRQYKKTLPAIAITYVVLQLLIGMASNVGDLNAPPPLARVTYFYYSAGFSFFMFALQTLGKIYECAFTSGSLENGSMGVYCAALVESLIASSSSLLTAFWGYGGVCSDVLGAYSPCAMWAEWMCSVPLLLYMSIAIEDKPALTTKDIVVILAILLCVACGFFMNFKGVPPALGIALFILGSVSLLVTMLLGVVTEKRSERTVDVIWQKEHVDRDSRFLAQSSKKRLLSRLVVFFMPLFPVVNILQYVQVFDRDTSFIAYQFLGVITKLLFLSTLSDAHISLTQTINVLRLSAEESANATRRTFLRYVFNEVRAPLNTMAMGMTVVNEETKGKGKDGRVRDTMQWGSVASEAMTLMGSASEFMGDTLNDVLAMHQIEEGTFRMRRAPFVVSDLIAGALSVVSEAAENKSIQIVLEGASSGAVRTMSQNTKVDKRVIGDRFRLEQALSNFLHSAIAFSPVNSSIIVRVNIQDYMLKKAPWKVVRRGGTVAPSTGKDTEFIRVNVPHEDNVNNVIHAETSGENNRPVEPTAGAGGGGVGNRPVSNAPPRMTEVTVLVVDQGVGFSKIETEGLFSPYSTIRPEALQEGKGTGLGLALAKEIVIMHGGRILRESSIGKGSAFGFCIPFNIATAEDTAREGVRLMLGESRSARIVPDPMSLETRQLTQDGLRTAGSKSDAVPHNLTTVMVAGDARSDIKMLSMLLRMKGISCDIAFNANQTLEMMRRNGTLYQVVFIDHDLPGGWSTSGFQSTTPVPADNSKASLVQPPAVQQGGYGAYVVNAIRNEHRYKNLVFGLSGKVLEDDASDLLTAGADCVISKQLRASQLDAVLQYVRIYGFESKQAKHVIGFRSIGEYTIRRVV